MFGEIGCIQRWSGALEAEVENFSQYQKKRGRKMEPRIVMKDEFNLIGIECRTKNADEMTPHGKIGPMWGRFAAERVVERIPDKTEPCAYGLYTDYESDENGTYTLLAGCTSKSLDKIPEGMTGIHVPKTKYAVFTSEKGPLPRIGLELWQHIWNYSKQGVVERTFTHDFELYDERSKNLNDGQIEIWIGIK